MRPVPGLSVPASMLPSPRPTIREQAAAWAVRLDEGALTTEEQAALLTWLEAAPAHADALERALAVWRQLDGAVVQSPMPARGNGADRPMAGTFRRHRPTRRRVAWAAAALVLLLLGGYLQRERAGLWLHADQRTATGETRRITLEGGSDALLDAQSAVAVLDNAQWREVSVLEGRAFFNVGHRDARPFRVRAGDWTVTDVGTTFQLARQGDQVHVVVASGSVDIRGPAGQETVHAGEQASIASDGSQVVVGPADVDVATAWTRGRLVFVNQPLRDVVDELNRYYDGRIVILGRAAADRRVSGVFKTAEPLAAVHAIEQNLGLRTSRLVGGLVVLHD